MNDEWQTPKEFFDLLNDEFNFDFDVCQNKNGLLPYLGDYFLSDYKDCKCFMNPPYSKPKPFVNRAIELIKNNVKTVCLLKCDTSTILFNELYGKHEIRFIKGRLKFINPEFSKSVHAPFPSMLVIIK